MSAREEFVDIEERQPTEALAIRDTAIQIVVQDQESLTRANQALIRAKEWLKHCDEEFDKGISEAFRHHRTLVAQKQNWMAPALEVERLLKPKIAKYLYDEDQRRLEAERASQRAREAAAKEAEDTADVAHELIKEGKLAEAEQVVEMQAEKIGQIQAAAPVVPDKPVAPGATLKTTWDFEIENVGQIPPEFMLPDLVKIRRYGQNMKEQARIPGVRFFAKQTVSVKVS